MRTAAAVLLSLLLAIPVLGAVRDERATRSDDLDWADVGLHGDVAHLGSSDRFHACLRPCDDRGGTAGSGPRSDDHDRPTTRPNPVVPSPHLVVVDLAGPADGQHHVLLGRASWYCGHGSPCTRGYVGGLYAAAGPALRVGDWRGRTVMVHAGASRTVRVTLIDWCACPNGRLLDLYSAAFEELAHYTDKYGRYHTGLDKGLLRVEVSW